MKKSWLILLFPLGALLTNCTEQQSAQNTIKQESSIVQDLQVPNKTVNSSNLNYNRKNSLWTLNGVVFSGYAINHYPDSTVKQKFGILNGKKQNEAFDWYPNGDLKFLATYHKGRLHGEKKKWSADSSHTLVSHLNYSEGKLHGVQKKWYVTGEIFKVLQMDMGQEKGIQKGFRKNGKLFANYEAKKGRSFGLKKATLCYGLEEEKTIFKKQK